MSLDAIVKGLVRRLTVPDYPDQDEQEPALNNRGELLIVQALPDLTEIVRQGGSWQLSSTTGQAALTALPTTVSGLSLVNNELGVGKCYAIESFGSVEEVVDATQTDVTGLFAMLNKSTSAKASGGTAETGFRSFSARPNYGGAATALRGATVVNDAWFPHQTTGAQMAAAAAGANWKVNECQARGLYLVPPGVSFSVQAVKAAAAAAAQQFFFIRWHEVQLPFAT